MFQGQYVFSQISKYINQYEFDKCVKRYNGNQRIRNLSCRDQLLAMLFGQLTNLRSLRGIVLCLNAHANLLYHLGFKVEQFTLSTLSRANENNNFSIELNGAVYVLDSTIIELCLATFKWAYFELGKSAVKIHTQLDLRGNIPSFILITQAKTHDIHFLDILEFERDAFYIMDRGYLDFERFLRKPL